MAVVNCQDDLRRHQLEPTEALKSIENKILRKVPERYSPSTYLDNSVMVSTVMLQLPNQGLENGAGNVGPDASGNKHETSEGPIFHESEHSPEGSSFSKKKRYIKYLS
jgi:hypothetical protein